METNKILLRYPLDTAKFAKVSISVTFAVVEIMGTVQNHPISGQFTFLDSH